MDAIAAAAIRKLSEFEPEELASTAWAVAPLGCGDPPLLEALAASARATRGPGPAEGEEGERPRERPAERAPGRRARPRVGVELSTFGGHGWRLLHFAPEFQPQHLVYTAWSCAVLMFANFPLLESISASAIRSITAFGPKAFSNMAWSDATLLYENPPLLAAIAASALRTIAECPSDVLSTTAWSFASLG